MRIDGFAVFPVNNRLLPPHGVEDGGVFFSIIMSSLWNFRVCPPFPLALNYSEKTFFVSFAESLLKNKPR